MNMHYTETKYKHSNYLDRLSRLAVHCLAKRTMIHILSIEIEWIFPEILNHFVNVQLHLHFLILGKFQWISFRLLETSKCTNIYLFTYLFQAQWLICRTIVKIYSSHSQLMRIEYVFIGWWSYCHLIAIILCCTHSITNDKLSQIFSSFRFLFWKNINHKN